MDRLRISLAALVLALPPAAIATSWWLLAAQLPPTIATHWSSTDVADGFAGTSTVAIVLLAVTTTMLVIGLALTAVRIGNRLRATILSLLAAVSGVLATAWVTSAITTAAAGRAADARLGWWIVLVLGGVALMLVPWFVHPRERVRSRGAAAPLPLSPSEASSWSGTASASLFLWLAAAMTLGAVALALILPVAASAGIGVVVAVVLLAAAAFVAVISRIRVTVDEQGLRVRSALVGMPLRTVPTRRIRAVEARAIEPMEWGGWGCRALPGQRAIVLGARPGIVITTREGSRFAVTVDDPQTGASVLAAIIERQRDREAPPPQQRPGQAER